MKSKAADTQDLKKKKIKWIFLLGSVTILFGAIATFLFPEYQKVSLEYKGYEWRISQETVFQTEINLSGGERLFSYGKDRDVVGAMFLDGVPTPLRGESRHVVVYRKKITFIYIYPTI